MILRVAVASADPAPWVGYCVAWARRMERRWPRVDWEQAALWALYRAYRTFNPLKAGFQKWIDWQLLSARRTELKSWHRKACHEITRAEFGP